MILLGTKTKFYMNILQIYYKHIEKFLQGLIQHKCSKKLGDISVDQQ